MNRHNIFILSVICGLGMQSGLLSAQQNREWTIVASFTIPGKASGLAWDGTYIYSGLYGTTGPDNLIYQIDPEDGSYTLLCTAPQETSYGLCFDGTDFWSTDRTGSYTPAIAVEFDYSGNLLSSFELPATYMSGIEYDQGNFWVCCYYNPDGMVYKLNGSGAILTQFPSPSNQPWAICKENEFLWIADYNANMLYKVETDGTLVESHSSSGIKPSGVTFDGQFLWYCDGELNTQSTLYKVDLGGSGTPEITIPVSSHDYGIVTVGDSPTWDMLVQNTGTGNLVISDVQIPGGVPVSTTFSTPCTLTPSASVYIPLTYSPTVPGTLSAVVTVISNDPLNPGTPVYLSGEAVALGPVLQAEDVSHHYGDVRKGAFTRWYLRVWNIGSEDLVISEINFSGNDFFLDEQSTLPITLTPLDTAAIGVWFNPDSAISYTDIMQIVNNDPGQNPFDVFLLGDGMDIPWPIGTPLWHYTIDVSYDNSPKAIIPIGDITGDKVVDVIIGSEDNHIRCFNGNSHGIADVMWDQEVYAGSVYSQNSLIEIEDIDGDDCNDVVAGTAWGDRSVIAFSGRTGQILWKHDTHEYGGGGWVYQVDARFDYNGDGTRDIIAATGDDSEDTGPRRIYCLDAFTGLSIWECFTGGPNFSAIGIEDFTGDGIPDALAGASNSQETVGRVYGIDGSNGQIRWDIDMTGSSVWALEQTEDIDNDGIRDVIAGDFTGYISILSSTGGGVLESSWIGNVLILRLVKVDDINSDGHQDLLVAHSGTQARIVSGADAGTLWSHGLADKSWCVAGSNDLNGDGISDVLAGTLYNSNYCYFLDGATGSELKNIPFGTPVDAINAIPDIVGDGTYEMVAGGRDGRVYCYSGGVAVPVSVESPGDPARSGLIVNTFPNPFSEKVKLSFTLEEECSPALDIYSAGSNIVCRFFAGKLQRGKHEFFWDGRTTDGLDCPSGIYFFRLIAGTEQSTGTLILVQ